MNEAVMVHRSTDSRVLALAAEHAAEYRAWRQDLRVWADRHKITPDPVFTPEGRLVGFDNPEDRPAPDGWRFSLDGLLIPNIRSTRGRELAREVGKLLPPPSVHDRMPDIAHSALTLPAPKGERRMVSYHLESHERGTALYAVWAGQVGASVATPPTWEPVDWDDYQLVVRREGAT